MPDRIEPFAIDGLDIHFLHVRSPHPGAVPLLMIHGTAATRPARSETESPSGHTGTTLP